MIESRLDAATDGTGGGYGKYAGLTVAQIAERFRQLVDEGQGRSARAILRMVHEQTEARGALGTQRLLFAIGLALTLGLLAFRAVVGEAQSDKLTNLIIATAGITVLFGVGAASVHRATVRAQAQVSEIRRLALTALDALVSKPGFVTKELEREHRASLDTLRKVDREAWERVSTGLGVNGP